MSLTRRGLLRVLAPTLSDQEIEGRWGDPLEEIDVNALCIKAALEESAIQHEQSEERALMEGE